MCIKLSLSSDGQQLKVTEVNEDHNHAISKVSGMYPTELVVICLYHNPTVDLKCVCTLTCRKVQDGLCIKFVLICSHSQAIYDHLPRQRQLGDSVKREAEDMLRMKVDKTLLQQHLIEKTGKVVTMRDIINIQAGLDTHSDGNNMETLVTRLRAIDGMVLSTSFQSACLYEVTCMVC